MLRWSRSEASWLSGAQLRAAHRDPVRRSLPAPRRAIAINGEHSPGLIAAHACFGDQVSVSDVIDWIGGSRATEGAVC